MFHSESWWGRGRKDRIWLMEEASGIALQCPFRILMLVAMAHRKAIQGDATVLDEDTVAYKNLFLTFQHRTVPN
jgi:hypothetical protein